jgi:hypothetical protein
MPQSLRLVTPEYAKKYYGVNVIQDAPPPLRDEDATLMPAPKRQKKVDVIWSDGTMPPLTNDPDAHQGNGNLF